MSVLSFLPTMYRFCMDSFTAEWLCCPRNDFDIFTSNRLQNAERIFGRILERSIPMNCADAQEIQFRTSRRQQNRECILK